MANNKPPFALQPGQELLNPGQQNQLIQSFKNKNSLSSIKVSWFDILNKPVSFPVSQHTHGEQEVIGLINDLKKTSVPFATTTSPGIIQVGSGLTVDSGILSVTSQGLRRINGEVPGGTINGTNTVFNLSSVPVPGTEEIFVGVGRVFPGSDYSIAGQVITFVTGAQPVSGGSVHASYFSVASAGNRVNNEVLTGVIDGINTVFNLSSVPVPGTEEIFVGVGRAFPGSDYNATGTTIQFVNGAQPVTGSSVRGSYFAPIVSGNRVNNEAPNGTIDGTNTVFSLSQPPLLSTEEIYVGAGRVFPGIDYTISGSTFTFINGAQPVLGNSVHASYFV